MKVNLSTANRDPYAIFALIDLWRATQDNQYLAVAEKVADNILTHNRHNGFFMDSPDLQFADIDNIAPYALLALEAARQNKPDAVAPFLNGSGFTEGAYRMANGDIRVSTRDEELFRLKVGEQLAPNGKK